MNSTTVAVSILAFSATLARPVSAQDVSYPLACRGPMSVGVTGYRGDERGNLESRFFLDFPLTANATAAGPRVEGLSPGTCAWLDRPLGEGEPRTLRVWVDPGYFIAGGGLSVPPMLAPFLECLTDAGCVAVIPARSQWFDQLGVEVVGSGTPLPGSRAVLFAAIRLNPPPIGLSLVRLANPVRPTMAGTGAVEVVAPN